MTGRNPYRSVTIYLCVCFLLISMAQIKAHAGSIVWDLDLMPPSTSDYTRLTVDGRETANLPTARLRQYIDVRSRLFQINNTYAKILISNQPELNAYAYSTNGQRTVVLTLRMVEALGDDVDAIAMLMGHEIAHIERGHGTKRVVRTTILDILAALAGAALEAKLQTKGYTPGLGQNIAGLGEEVVGNAFSRDAEREADELGLRWLIAAGYNPQGSVRLFKRLMQENGDGGGFLSSHPSSTERIDNIYSQLAKLTPPSKPSSAIVQTAAVTSPAQVQSDRPATPALPSNLTGQVGVVLSVKERHGYALFIGTTPYELPVGTNIRIVSSTGKLWESKISRSVDGYCSTIVSGDISSISQGDRVEIIGRK